MTKFVLPKREIKFRAWYRHINKWLYFSLDQLSEGDTTSKRSHLSRWCEYTGLKDKNGVEIYEGDIVLLEKSFIQHGEGDNDFSNTKIVGDKAIHYGVLFMNVSSEDYKEQELQNIIHNRYRVYGQKVGVVVFGEYDFCLEYYSESHNGWSVKPLVVEENNLGNEKQSIPLLEGRKFEIIGNVFENPGLILKHQGE